MAKGKYAGKKSLNVKPIAMLLAIGLLVGSAIGGTLAWLTDDTDPVTNTFTVGNIEIDLGETTTDYKMIPGNDIAKDPKVTVVAGSEDAWVFVKVAKSSNFDDYLTYTIADGWTALADDKDNSALTTVYYREYTGDEAANYPVLKDNKTHVKNTVTKDDMDALLVKENGEFKLDGNGNFVYDADKVPTLTFTAYAIQKANVGNSAADAWDEILNP